VETRCFGRTGLAIGPRTADQLTRYTRLGQQVTARRALGRNVEWDDRAPVERAQLFLQDLEGSLANASGHCLTLEDGLREYVRTHIRTAKERCAYTGPANAGNRLSGNSLLAPSTAIGTVVNLSWRGDVFRWAPFPRSPADEAEWWADWFPESGEGDQEEQGMALGEGFLALFAHATARQYRPVWAAEWSRLDGGCGARRWDPAVGHCAEVPCG